MSTKEKQRENLQKIYSTSSSFNHPFRSYFQMIGHPRFSLRLINFAARVIVRYKLDVKDIQKKKKRIKKPICCRGCEEEIKWYQKRHETSDGIFHSRCHWSWYQGRRIENKETPILIGRSK